jgi:branched-chain amino acid transport system substrate-binding protein
MMSRRSVFLGVAFLASAFLSDARAQKQYDPGASDSEIRIGNVAPYSGPGSPYSAIAKAEDAYFKMLNDNGGINGRKINFISYDDAFSPPKAAEQTKKLVERDEVLVTISPLGNPAFAIQKYLNTKQVPQLFIMSGISKASMPATHPWSTGWTPPYAVESVIYAKHILQTKPSGKIGVLSQNDEFGREFLVGLKKGLGDRASMIVAEAVYVPTDPTVDSQVINIQNSGADIFISLTTAKAAAQAIRKVAELGWKPTYYQFSGSTSIGAVLRPAGLENAVGMLSVGIFKDPSDPAWKDDPGMKRFTSFMETYMPEADKTDALYINGYAVAQALEHAVRKSGDNLTRENVLNNVIAMNKVGLDVLFPDVTIDMTANSYFPFKKMRMIRFNGSNWDILTPAVDGSKGLE